MSFLGERLRASQWAGLGLSFAGVALAIGVPQANVDANVLLGDLLIVAGGALWAATTLLVKATALIKAPAEKGLGYQVAMSIPILGLAAWVSGERITHVPGLLSLSLLAYQAFWVVGLTFLLWFALIKTYSASKLSAFTFITPLFGVVASYFIMHDTLTLAFGVAALLVIAGLYLVNRPEVPGRRWCRIRTCRREARFISFVMAELDRGHRTASASLEVDWMRRGAGPSLRRASARVATCLR